MTAGVKNAPLLVDTRYIDTKLLLQDVYLLIERQRTGRYCPVIRCPNRLRTPAAACSAISVTSGLRHAIDILPHITEDPGLPECGTPHHHRIHTIGVEGMKGLLRSGDVAIADDGDMDTGVALPRRSGSNPRRPCTSVSAYGHGS